MNRIIVFASFILCMILFSCSKQKADSIFYNAKVFTVDSVLSIAEAFAIKDGKIVAVGTSAEILKNYEATEQTDLQNKFVYPGMIDAHAHFYGLGMYMQTVDLTGTKSFEEVVERCIKFYSLHPKNYLLGRGWDQNDWEKKEFPTNAELNKIFSNIPVLLKRVDGHAAIANDFALRLSNLSETSKIDGGEFILQNKKLTGVLVDNAVDLVEKVMPQTSIKEKIKALKDAEQACFEYGLTSVCDPGLERETIDLIDSLQKAGTLSIRVYAMVSISDKNVEHYLKQGTYKTDKLNVRSFKIYCDGALGSRGACLLKPYSDKENALGFLLTPINKMDAYVSKIVHSNFQVNTHCIGDSANRLILKMYAKYLKGKNDKRWRIEHAQIVNPADIGLFGEFSIIPSVQPTHATSDMYWVETRLGKERTKQAYAYKNLLKQNGWLPLGTDFPVESVSPFYTFDAAVSRKDANGFPLNGFQTENALTREEALKGITIWAAKAQLEEHEKGSLESGKFADFVLLDVDLLKDDLHKIRNSKAIATFVGGKKVR